MSFATRLKKLRMKDGESLQEAADAVGISKAHFWDLESGNSKNPSVDLLEKVATHFKVSIATLVGENPESDDDEWAIAMFRDLKKLDPADRELLQLIVEQKRKQAKKGDDKN